MRFHTVLLIAALVSFAAPADAGGRAEVRVRAHVLPVVKMRHANAVQTVQVPDAMRAEVEVPQAATFEVFSNTGGFSVEFEVADPAVEEVVVAGLDAPVRIGAQGGSAPVRLAADARIERRTLHYRVRYAAGTPPGPRPAPLAVAIRANI